MGKLFLGLLRLILVLISFACGVAAGLTMGILASWVLDNYAIGWIKRETHPVVPLIAYSTTVLVFFGVAKLVLSLEQLKRSPFIASVAVWAAVGAAAWCFGSYCTYLEQGFGSHFDGELSSENNSGQQLWVKSAKYALDNIAESVFFDIPNIYEIKLVEAKPVSMVAKTSVQIFRILTSIFLVFSLHQYAISMKDRLLLR